MLESLDPVDPSAWAVLGDWLLERGLSPGPTPLPSVAGMRATVRWRLGFVTTAALEFEPDARPGLYDLQPLLRSRALRLTNELRVGARVVPQAMMFSANAVLPARIEPPLPAGLTARQLEAVLASAPSSLRSLVVWQAPEPTDPTSLVPLTRQRPLSARHLVLRAHSQLLLHLVDGIAAMRWQTITLRSTWRAHELKELDGLVARHPEVQFELVGAGPARRDNLRWVPDGDGLTVSTRDESWAITPDALVPTALTSLLWHLGLVLHQNLGAFELERHPSLTEGAVVEIDGVPLTAPRRLEPGVELQVRVDEPGHGGHVGPAGGVMVFGMGPPPRHYSGRLSITR